MLRRVQGGVPRHVLCHALFLFYGYTSPDGTNEGLFYYWNQNWALHRSVDDALPKRAGCNVVMPAIFLAFNAACTAVAMLLLADLWHIESKTLLILSTVSLVVAPSVIEQHLVIYMAYVYGFSLLMTALASYLVLAKKGCPPFVVAVLALACGMGGYQAWIGFATGVIVMTLMLDCLQERPLPDIFRRAGKALAMGLLGAAVYFAVLQFEIHRYNIELSDKGGLSGFGAGSLSGLGSKILQAYRDFKDYFTSGPNHTGKMLLVILLGTAVLLFLGWLRLVRRRKPQAILLAVLGLLLPLAINIVDVLIEGQHQRFNEPPDADDGALRSCWPSRRAAATRGKSSPASGQGRRPSCCAGFAPSRPMRPTAPLRWPTSTSTRCPPPF